MSIRGSLRTLSIADMLDWLDRRFLCGSLTVERGAVVRGFEFDSGYITSASSNVPGEHLGQMLLSRGVLTEQTLSDAFRTQAETGVLLGKVLIMVGAVSEEELGKTIEEKIFESICEVLTWDEGRFLFDDRAEPQRASEFEISVNLKKTCERGLKRVDEWRQVRERIPSDDYSFFVKDHFRLQGEVDAGELDRLDLIDGIERGLTANQLILSNNGQRFNVLTHLAALLDEEIVGIEKREETRPRAAPELDVEELAAAARGRASGGDRTGAMQMVRGALEELPEDKTLQDLFRELERSVLAELTRDLLSSFRVPKLLKSAEELQGIDLNDAERYLAGRVDGRWDLLSLMRISPLRDVDVLITFKQLAERGIISL